MTHNTFILQGIFTHSIIHTHTHTPAVSLLSVYSLTGVIYLRPEGAERTNCIQKVILHCQRRRGEKKGKSGKREGYKRRVKMRGEVDDRGGDDEGKGREEREDRKDRRR